jgi:hypothetical protein
MSSERTRLSLSPTTADNHGVVLTHADLDGEHILVTTTGRITGFID